MLLADVNVLIYAHRPDSSQHEAHRRWLTAALDADEPLGVSELVLSAVVRIVTNHRVFADPTPTQTALDFCDTVRRAPGAVVVRPGERHWGIFRRLCTDGAARGNLIPDAYLAALAIEHGATWITTDRGFARFPGLRWRHPLSE